MTSRRPIRALWMLALFVLAQLVPVAALAATDGMAGMACCKDGKDSCCRRKAMRKAPAMVAGHGCAACHGMPTVAGAAADVTAPALAAGEFAGGDCVAVGVEMVGMAAGAEAWRFQRPPPDGFFS